MGQLVSLLVPGLGAAVLSFVLTPVASSLAFRLGAIDHPGPRKIHRTPIPRLGGLAVLASVILSIVGRRLLLPGSSSLVLPGTWILGLGLGLLPIVIISVRDDIRPLPALPKLLAHLCGAAVAVSFGVALSPTIHLFGLELEIGWLSIPLSIAWFVGVTNAFNLVDGLDGLSAGLALISAGSLAAVFFVSRQYALAGTALILAGALAGFLPFNLFPARVFLGDTGATALGFVLAGLALSGGARLSQGFATLLPLFAIGLPIAETLVSIVRRVVRRLGPKGEGGVFEADRNHIHHRLLALGIHHRQAVHILYGAALVFAAGGLASILISTRKAGLLLVTLMVAALIGIARLGYDEFAVIRKGAVLNVYEYPVLKRSFFVVFVDLAMIAIAAYLAAGLKWDLWALDSGRALLMQLYVLLAPVTVAAFWVFGLYRGAWRHASLDDFLRATVAIGAASAAAGVIALFALSEDVVGFLVIHTLLMLCFVNGSRVSYRVLQHRMWQATSEGERVLIYGAGLGGASALRELLSNRAAGMKPVGFLDDDPEKEGRVVNGYPVLGTLEDVPELVREHDIRSIVVSSTKIGREKTSRAFELCHEAGARLLRFQIVFEPVVRVVEAEAFRTPDPDTPDVRRAPAHPQAERQRPSPNRLLGP